MRDSTTKTPPNKRQFSSIGGSLYAVYLKYHTQVAFFARKNDFFLFSKSWGRNN